MESAQGIILVIANQADTPFTNIFKFDQNNEKVRCYIQSGSSEGSFF